MEIKQELLEDIITNNMGEYSTYVLLQRAIPDIRDGLKPSYRRGLWTMKEMGATKLTKSAHISGQVMKLHPHGSIYQTLVGMAQKDAQINPYLIGKGNFGAHSSDKAFASERYTEMKLSDISLDMMADVGKDSVRMIDNFDSTAKMPEVLPVKYPSILAYAQSGIGVGFSSSIPSFNVTELNKAVIKYIKTGKKTMLVPDFATKGLVIEDDSIIKSINEDGRGSIRQRARARIEGNEIIVTEFPYDTTREKIINRIIKLHKDGKLNEVKDVEDSSGLSGMSVIITAKRNTDMEVLLEKLYQNTPMGATYSSNMMVISTDGLPRQMGVWSIIEEWLEWRREVITRMLAHDTKIKKRNLEILYGLEIIKGDLDKVVEIIRKSTDDTITQNLMKEFDLSELQAQKIGELKLKNLTDTFIKHQMKSIDRLEKVIKENELAIESDIRKNEMIVEDLETIIKKFGKERHSEIIHKEELNEQISEIPEEPEFEDYNLKLFTTKENYVKKIPLTSLRGDFEIKTKHGDEIVEVFETTNKAELLVFTDQHNVYKKNLHELADDRPSTLGTFLPGELELEDEEILYTCVLDDNNKWLLVGFDNGRVSKIDLDAYKTKTNRTMLKNAYANKTPLLFKVLSEDIDLMAIAEDGKTVLINTEIISPKASRTTQGNIFIRLRDDIDVREYIVNPDFEGVEYYRVKSASIGKYWKGD